MTFSDRTCPNFHSMWPVLLLLCWGHASEAEVKKGFQSAISAYRQKANQIWKDGSCPPYYFCQRAVEFNVLTFLRARSKPVTGLSTRRQAQFQLLYEAMFAKGCIYFIQCLMIAAKTNRMQAQLEYDARQTRILEIQSDNAIKQQQYNMLHDHLCQDVASRKQTVALELEVAQSQLRKQRARVRSMESQLRQLSFSAEELTLDVEKLKMNNTKLNHSISQSRDKSIILVFPTVPRQRELQLRRLVCQKTNILANLKSQLQALKQAKNYHRVLAAEMAPKLAQIQHMFAEHGDKLQQLDNDQIYLQTLHSIADSLAHRLQILKAKSISTECSQTKLAYK